MGTKSGPTLGARACSVLLLLSAPKPKPRAPSGSAPGPQRRWQAALRCEAGSPLGRQQVCQRAPKTLRPQQQPAEEAQACLALLRQLGCGALPNQTPGAGEPRSPRNAARYEASAPPRTQRRSAAFLHAAKGSPALRVAWGLGLRFDSVWKRPTVEAETLPPVFWDGKRPPLRAPSPSNPLGTYFCKKRPRGRTPSLARLE